MNRSTKRKIMAFILPHDAIHTSERIHFNS